MTKITTAKVTAALATAVTAHGASRKAIQTALVAMVKHAQDHNAPDFITTHAYDFVMDLQGANKKALVDFIVKFGGVRVVAQGFKSDDKATVDAAAAAKCDWWTLSDPNPFIGFDLAAAIAAVIKKADNASAEEDQSKVYIDKAALKALAGLQSSAQKVTDTAKAQAKAAAKA